MLSFCVQNIINKCYTVCSPYCIKIELKDRGLICYLTEVNSRREIHLCLSHLSIPDAFKRPLGNLLFLTYRNCAFLVDVNLIYLIIETVFNK
jgi:hypothetical protein